MSKKKEQLGKGIRALLQNIDTEAGSPQKTPLITGVSEIPLTAIEVNPFQPRADFNEGALKELSNSIKIHGVIQPITVRRLSNSKYQLISGERRLRASKMAGKTTIPAYVRSANDQEMLEIALIENIQREDLNAMEISINYQRLLDECSLKHDELAERVGKDRSTVTNYLRLLKLPPELQKGVKEHSISMGHARALISLDDPVAQIDLHKRIIEQGLSVRQVEQAVKSYKPSSKKKSSTGSGGLPSDLRRLQDGLASHLSARVLLKPSSSGKGEIVINYLSEEDLYRIAELLQ